MNKKHLNVAEHYEKHVVEYEKIRLEQDSPVEFTLTLRKLTQQVPNSSIVADIGVGVGHYADNLAKRGCYIHLVDIVQSFIDHAKQRFLFGLCQVARRA